ncbi:MAG: OmpA family protein [Bacteroidetes bacterium]|nr:MAG: OmpA family protein [Bacteroidota bacterium]
MRFTIIITLSLMMFCLDGLFAQDEPIVLENPSFEDMPRHSRQPRGWYDCGFPGESAPDTQPGFFDVTQLPQDGDSYLGLVVRDNETWEMVAQRLSRPLEAGKCYEFSVYLSRSELYLSPGKDDLASPGAPQNMKNHTTPVKLRIWGGSGYCNKAELLAESSLIINTRWLEYNFKFEPKNTHTYILFEAFYKTPTLFPYNGNILMDNASPIYPVDCDVENPTLADNTPPKKEEEKPVVEAPPPPPPTPNPEPVVSEKPPKILQDLDRKNLKTGQTIRLEKLYFAMDESTFTPDSYEVLDELYEFLKDNQDVRVEIGGHTNTIPDTDYCDRLSTARAKAVVDYLISKGIDSSRLEYKGYGKRQPIIRNDKYNLEARKKNQRVEIRILSMDG